MQVNLAYRWFCELSIEDNIPDHSAFCHARHERFRESDALRRVFEGAVAKRIAAGLVGGEAVSVSASPIKADVDKKKRMPGDQTIAWPKAEEASHAVRDYLTALDNARTGEENDRRDGDDSGSGGGCRRKPPKEVSLTDPQAAWLAASKAYIILSASDGSPGGPKPASLPKVERREPHRRHEKRPATSRCLEPTWQGFGLFRRLQIAECARVNRC